MSVITDIGFLDSVLNGRVVNNGIMNAINATNKVADSVVPSGLMNFDGLKMLQDRSLLSNGATGGRYAHLMPNLLEVELKPMQIEKIKTLASQRIAEVFDISIETASEFVTISDRLFVPLKGVYQPEIRDFMAQMRVIELISDMNDAHLVIFNDFMYTIRGDKGIRGALDLTLIEEVRSSLLDGPLAQDGPLGQLFKPAVMFLNNLIEVLPIVDKTEAQLNTASMDIAKLFNVPEFPVQIVANLVNFKVNLASDVVDLTEGVVVSVVDITADIVKFAGEMAKDVAELAILLPKFAVEWIFELLFAVNQVIIGAIDVKFAVLEILAKLPFELISLILEIPISVFESLGFAKVEALQGFWDELRKMLILYTDFGSILDLTPELFSLEYFAEMTKELAMKALPAAKDCVDDMCFTA